MTDWSEVNERHRQQHALELETRVRAANAANAYANDLWQKLTEIFRPFVGKQITAKSGQLLSKVEKLLPEFPCTPDLHVYRHVTNYSLAWTVKACEVAKDVVMGHGGIANYWETTVYIGDLQGTVLSKLCESYQDKPIWRTDYTVEEVLANREAAKAAKKAYDDAKNNCYPFGEG